jgi:hypothetical protein
MKKFIYTTLAFVLGTAPFAARPSRFTGNCTIDSSKATKGKGPSPQTARMVTEEGDVITMTQKQHARDGNEITVVRKFSTDDSEVTGKVRGQPMKSHGTWEGTSWSLFSSSSSWKRDLSRL